MKYAWLAVPVILIIAFGVAFFLSQPKENPAAPPESSYVDVNGDDWLADEYVTSIEDELKAAPTSAGQAFSYPKSVSDCGAYKDEYARDRCYLLYVLGTGDPAGCEAAKGIETRDECYFEAAGANAKPEMCDKISYGRQECYLNVAIETNNPELCQKSAAEIAKCEAAVDSGKVEDCPIEDDAHFCGDAVLAKDKSICANMRSYDSFCNFRIALDTNNSSLCNKAGPSKDSCIFQVATTVNNAAICESLTETRDNCVAWVAFNTGNKQLCYQAGAEAQSCLDDLSEE